MQRGAAICWSDGAMQPLIDVDLDFQAQHLREVTAQITQVSDVDFVDVRQAVAVGFFEGSPFLADLIGGTEPA